MKRLGIVALLIGAGLGVAESKSLGECRSISNKTERLDCYDRIVDAPVEHVNLGGEASSALPKQKDLSGFYLGATFGFGSSSKIDRADYGYVNGIPNGYSDFDLFRANSPTIGITGGYNAFSGNTLFGLQVDITGDLTEKKRSFDHQEYSYEFPRQGGWGWSSSPHGKPVGSADTFEYAGGTQKSAGSSFYRYSEQIAPTLSLRFGQQFDSWIVYGRVGAGLSRIKETFGYDDSKSVLCGSTTTETRYTWPNTTEYWTTACNNPYNGSITSSSRTVTRPTATLALGSEYHFDRYFTRLEGEMRHTFLDEKLDFSPANGVTQYKVSTGIGIRF